MLGLHTFLKFTSSVEWFKDGRGGLRKCKRDASLGPSRNTRGGDLNKRQGPVEKKALRLQGCYLLHMPASTNKENQCCELHACFIEPLLLPLD